jgi:hypothetical protein
MRSIHENLKQYERMNKHFFTEVFLLVTLSDIPTVFLLIVTGQFHTYNSFIILSKNYYNLLVR